MTQFSGHNQNGNFGDIWSARRDTGVSQTEPEKRLSDERVHQAFIKHYFNQKIKADPDLQRRFDQALDTILNSFKAHSDVFWTMGEAAQFREQCAPSDRAWQKSQDFWFMLSDPEEPSVPARYAATIEYALRDYRRPDMRGNLAQVHVSVAKTMIARSATFAIKELSVKDAAEEEITATSDQADRLIKVIENAVEIAQGVYESACRDATRALNRIQLPARTAVGP
jgi:hypothetical protein